MRDNIEFTPLSTNEDNEDNVIDEISPVKQKKTKIAYFIGNCLVINLPYKDIRLIIGPHWPGGMIVLVSMLYFYIVYCKLFVFIFLYIYIFTI